VLNVFVIVVLALLFLALGGYLSDNSNFFLLHMALGSAKHVKVFFDNNVVLERKLKKK
jgi:hypothetical protein